jgi:hypothetical protein
MALNLQDKAVLTASGELRVLLQALGLKHPAVSTNKVARMAGLRAATGVRR